MKRLILSLAVVGVTLASAAGMALAQATTNTFHQTVPVDPVLARAFLCTHEDVRLTGEVQILTRVTEDNNGGLHLDVHFGLKGVSGTGLESGTRYRVVNNSKTGQYIAPGEPRVARLEARFYLASAGPSDNTQTRIKARLVFNANGKPKVSFVSLSTRCVG